MCHLADQKGAVLERHAARDGRHSRMGLRRLTRSKACHSSATGYASFHQVPQRPVVGKHSMTAPVPAIAAHHVDVPALLTRLSLPPPHSLTPCLLRGHKAKVDEAHAQGGCCCCS